MNLTPYKVKLRHSAIYYFLVVVGLFFITSSVSYGSVLAPADVCIKTAPVFHSKHFSKIPVKYLYSGRKKYKRAKSGYRKRYIVAGGGGAENAKVNPTLYSGAAYLFVAHNVFRFAFVRPDYYVYLFRYVLF